MVEEKQEVQEKTESTPVKSSGRIAIVLVRGLAKVKTEVKNTLAMLRLTRKNNCVVIADNPVNNGMIKKVKDYITWGPISEETFNELVSKRGEEFKSRTADSKGKYNYKCLEVNGKKYKLYFRLNPPRKGFGRKGIKMAFKVGGGLGFRGDKMEDLIKRML